jgi:chromosome segregation ATPase
MPMMPDDLLQTLTRFHREVVVPDIERIVEARAGKTDERFDEILTHFDSIYQRFDRLETEYQAIVAGLDRIEKRMGVLERRMTALEQNGRSDLDELKAQVLELRDRLAAVEASLEQQRASNTQLATRNAES